MPGGKGVKTCRVPDRTRDRFSARTRENSRELGTSAFRNGSPETKGEGWCAKIPARVRI